MALLESLKLPHAMDMPEFNLNDPEGISYSGDELYAQKGLLLVFTCNHCPYAIAVWPRLIRLTEDARKLGINAAAINPNINPDYPDDSPENMKKNIKTLGIDFPYLVDETQDVARAFQAQCTPDIYLFNNEHKLVYHGRIDDNWQDETKVSRHELKEAIENLAHGKPISTKQVPSMGCSIKWR